MVLAIRIDNLKVKASIAWFDRELKNMSPFSVDALLCLKVDNLRDESFDSTVDYGFCVSEIKHLLSVKRFKLLENAASELADLLYSIPNIDACSVKITKYYALCDETKISVIASRGNHESIKMTIL